MESPAAQPLSLPDRWGMKAPFAALHHVALITDDMAKTVAFYRDVLGAEVALTHRMPREDRSRHYFLTIAPNVVFAFFEYRDAELPEYAPATFPKTGRSLDHIALFVPDRTAFEGWYERLRGKVDNLSPVRHLEFVDAFFFSDPNGIVLEIMVAQEDPEWDFPVFTDPEPAL